MLWRATTGYNAYSDWPERAQGPITCQHYCCVVVTRRLSEANASACAIGENIYWHFTYLIVMSRITSLLRRTFGVVKEHIGTDHLGNKYYLIPEQKSWTGRSCIRLWLPSNSRYERTPLYFYLVELQDKIKWRDDHIIIMIIKNHKCII